MLGAERTVPRHSSHGNTRPPYILPIITSSQTRVISANININISYYRASIGKAHLEYRQVSERAHEVINKEALNREAISNRKTRCETTKINYLRAKSQQKLPIYPYSHRILLRVLRGHFIFIADALHNFSLDELRVKTSSQRESEQRRKNALFNSILQ